MVEWVKVGTNVVVGGVVGGADQLLQNADDKRLAENPELGIMSQYGTYFNYGVPILAILGTAFGFLRGDWSTMAVTAGAQLAGRKITKQVTKVASWAGWKPRTDDARRRAIEEARRRAVEGKKPVGQVGTGNEITIPIVSEEQGMLV